ncbi:MAG: hypothetical protein AAGD01_16390 [Acidobacteriota bacterium]
MIRRIGVLSCGKILGAVYGVMGLLFGALLSVISLISTGATMTQGEDAVAGILFGLGAVIFLPIFYGIIGFIGGMIMSLIYNLLANIVGGLEVEFDSPLTTPKSEGYGSTGFG